MWTGPVGKIGNSGNIKFLKIHISTRHQQYRGQRKEQLSEKVCCWLVFLQNTVSTSVSVVDFWNHTTAYKQSGEQIQISNIYAYCECLYVQARLERVGYRDFLTLIDDNRWVATTFVWLSIGHRLANANRCQLTNKASIVIHWSIDFPDHRFHRLFTPWYIWG